MGRRSYTSEDHERAFHIWYDTKNWTRVMEAVGAAGSTVGKWADKNFRCPEGCPWHGWDDLVQERDRTIAVRSNLIEEGNFNPIDHDRAVRKDLDVRKVKPNRRAAIISIVNTDIDRLYHLQVLYNKLFYNLTGIQLGLDTSSENKFSGKVMREVYERGLQSESVSEALRCLKLVTDEIDKIRARNNALDVNTSEQEEEKQLTLSDIRNFRSQLQKMSPDQIDLIRSTIEKEDQQLSNATSELIVD